MAFGKWTNNNILGPGSMTDALDPYGLQGLGLGMDLKMGGATGLLNNMTSKLPGAPETVLDVQTHDTSHNWNNPTNTQYVIDPNTGVQTNQTFDQWNANGNLTPVPETSHLRYANDSAHKKSMGWKGVNTAPTVNPGDPYFMQTNAQSAAAKALAAAPLAAPVANSGAFKNDAYNWNGPQAAPTTNVFNPSMNQGKDPGMFGFGIIGSQPPTWDHDSIFDAPTAGSTFGGGSSFGPTNSGGSDGNYDVYSDFGSGTFGDDGMGMDSTGATASDYSSYDSPDESTGPGT